MNQGKKILLILDKNFPVSIENNSVKYDLVLGNKEFEDVGRRLWSEWRSVEDFLQSPSIYEASAFAEEISKLNWVDGQRLTSKFIYKGFELWWLHYNDLFYYFGLPLSRYRKLLDFLKTAESVEIFGSSDSRLFTAFLESYGCTVKVSGKTMSSWPQLFSFGIFIQFLITVISVPIVAIKRPHLLLFTGDKFEKTKDFDFRMRNVYKAVREKRMSFVECIRSLESWKTVISHAVTRRRPVIYFESVTWISRVINLVSGGYARGKKEFDIRNFSELSDPDQKFKLTIATHYIKGVYAEVWAIRVMTFIIRLIGVKSAFFTAALDRNYPAVLACKLNGIKTAGVLHGVASKNYNVYDFLPAFTGTKKLSLDAYGLWSDWWKEYYLKNGRAYDASQLFVSGPMRPMEKKPDASGEENASHQSATGPVKVLFVSEQLGEPSESLTYLESLLNQSDLEVTIIFRQYRDGFRIWLENNAPEVLKNPRLRISSKDLQTTISEVDVAVGSHSTAVLETLLLLKVPIFFKTRKWGDYYDLKEYKAENGFFADNPEGLVSLVKNARSVSISDIKNLQKRYFGDPYMDGSAWAVDQLR